MKMLPVYTKLKATTHLAKGFEDLNGCWFIDIHMVDENPQIYVYHMQLYADCKVNVVVCIELLNEVMWVPNNIRNSSIHTQIIHM